MCLQAADLCRYPEVRSEKGKRHEKLKYSRDAAGVAYLAKPLLFGFLLEGYIYLREQLAARVLVASIQNSVTRHTGARSTRLLR
jgi:hypothetical protein